MLKNALILILGTLFIAGAFGAICLFHHLEKSEYTNSEIAYCWYEFIKMDVRSNPKMKSFVAKMFEDGKITNGEWDQIREEEDRIELEACKKRFKEFINSPD
jgi:hypothetical protein